MPAPVDARVIQTAYGFKVVPPDVPKQSGDQFTLLNITGSTVHVSFPVLQTVPAEAEIASGSTAVFTISQSAPGIYDYWVQVPLSDSSRALTVRASGASDPHIIIDF